MNHGLSPLLPVYHIEKMGGKRNLCRYGVVRDIYMPGNLLPDVRFFHYDACLQQFLANDAPTAPHPLFCILLTQYRTHTISSTSPWRRLCLSWGRR